MPRIELTTIIAAPRERCFDLSRSVDFHLASAAASGEKAVGGKVSGLLELGEEVTFRARHLGIRQNLTSRITAFAPPAHFRDSMTRGAFRFFEHDHFFTALPAGGTEMRDVLVYRAPLGPLGWLAERTILTRYLTRFLEVRNHMIKQAAESLGGPTVEGRLPPATAPPGSGFCRCTQNSPTTDYFPSGRPTQLLRPGFLGLRRHPAR